MDGPLPKHFDVLAYDQRGLGQTSKPDVAYSMADYADDAAALMTAMGWDSALVAGFSFGGMVAQELALRHPQRAAAGAGLTSPGGAGGALSLPRDWPPDRGGQGCHKIPISDTRRMSSARANPDQYAQFVAMAAAPDPYADEPSRAMGAWRQIEARAAHDTWDRLPGDRPPDDDRRRPPTTASPRRRPRKLPASCIPGAELRSTAATFFIQDRAAWPASGQDTTS